MNFRCLCLASLLVFVGAANASVLCQLSLAGPSPNVIALEAILKEVPGPFDWKMPQYLEFQRDVNAINLVNERVHDFLWEYAQVRPKLALARVMEFNVYKNGHRVPELVERAEARERAVLFIEHSQLEIALHFRPDDRVPAFLGQFRIINAVTSTVMNDEEINKLVPIYQKWLADVARLGPHELVFNYFKQQEITRAFIELIDQVQVRTDGHYIDLARLTD